MRDFRRIVLAAVAAGIITGIVVTLLQSFTTVPLILQAETYETERNAQHVHDDSDHANSGWEPDPGLERTAYSALTAILAAIGYGLLLGGVLHLTHRSGLRAGVAVGAIGFAVFQLAPALGLPPEPPGMPAAALSLRQLWWISTVLLSAGAFTCWYAALRRRSLLLFLAGVVLATLPHLVGAPHAPMQRSAVPPALVHDFATAALLVGAVFWLTLGAASGALSKVMEGVRIAR